MIFSGLKLPRRLQMHVANLSATIQVLLGEVLLHAEGLEADANRNAATEFETVMRNKKATELLARQLDGLLKGSATDDVAIAVAASAGRSTREIARFLGLEQQFVMRRLCAIRKLAAQVEASEESPAQSKGTGAQVLELFVEAQGRR